MEHFDVLIVGAGVSGLGAACHLRRQCPDRSFVILDDNKSFGGTWHTHRFPGIRSDSDLYTYGYRFKPWIGPPIATAPKILAYLAEAVEENGLAKHIRYQHRVTEASWSSDRNLWMITSTRSNDGDVEHFSAGFLFMCQGYYRHAQGYTPVWPGMDDFTGLILHPQTWPEDLDCTGKNIVVIGSGATAATIIPALAKQCDHVTMLQRSPTYYFSGTNTLPIADELRGLGIDETWIHEIARRKFLRDDADFMDRIRIEPDKVAEELIADVRSRLGENYDVDTHFRPNYRPWQQRLAFVPDGDLLETIRTGRASVTTGEIERFTASGIKLKSGAVLAADIIVTATGLELCSFGDIAFAIDGKPIKLADAVSYHGIMLADVPNLAWIFGYIRSSWTLRVDLVCDVVCRILNHMAEQGLQRVEPRLRPEDRSMMIGPWVEPDNFNPNYIARGAHLLPKRGSKPEWQHSHDYWVDKDRLPSLSPDDTVLFYS
ncbi:MAG: NAD(P)/FAD-dependent oxidoreductase [Rhizobiales bacterium]|nr:NAD(P)/FAD-dependent oxidoreductase [Hyphomicrobiales bacterium]